jgi:acetyltransferase-like isoleucine patch superfamily enzyme
MDNYKINMNQLLKLFLWKYFKFLRPSNIKISGKIIFNKYAQITIDKQSTINIEGDLEIIFSSIVLENSSFFSGKIVLHNSVLELHKSQIILGNSSHLKNAQVNCIQTKLIAQEQFRIHSINIIAIESLFEIGSYFFGQNIREGILKWSFIKAKAVVGKNTRLQCTIFQNDASLTIGSNSFINAGTSISCINNVTIGNYVMISYDCLIFDNNSHDLNYMTRREEIDNGFPNGTLPSSSNKPNSATISILDDVWVGARSTILKGISIKSKSVVASNTIVTDNVGELTLVYGNPNKYKPIEIKDI